MKIESVFDDAFAAYGQVYAGLDCAAFLRALEGVPLPEAGVGYQPSCPELEADPLHAVLRDHVFGGMPIQIGWCSGHNRSLNCLEYHQNSEVNLPVDDMVLLLAHRQELRGGTLDTSRVRAFHVPRGTVVELYATTLHYAPCAARDGGTFRVAIVLPRGTNTEKPPLTPCVPEDAMLWGRNKWLIAHPDAAEAAQGAYIGLTGRNITLHQP